MAIYIEHNTKENLTWLLQRKCSSHSTGPSGDRHEGRNVRRLYKNGN